MPPTAISEIMSTSNPTELPTEILEQILLRLPGQDIIKIVSVQRIGANSKQVVDFLPCDLGEPTLARPHP